MRRLMMPLVSVAVVSAMLSIAVSRCHAGILRPAQVTYGVTDLEKALDGGNALAASLATRSSDSSSSSSRRTTHDWPSNDPNQPTNPLELVKSSMPTGSSSGTSTSSTGGAIGSGVVICALNGTLTLRDDSPLGSLAEDHALSLPDPPGNQLLRPPRW